MKKFYFYSYYKKRVDERFDIIGGVLDKHPFLQIAEFEKYEEKKESFMCKYTYGLISFHEITEQEYKLGKKIYC